MRDMVHAQQRLITRLGIERLHAVIGGCFGGQQAIEWAIQHPGQVGNAVVITTTSATSAHSIATFTVMRRLIRGDPAWNGGDYYGESFPASGRGAAIAAAVPLWVRAEAMDARFARPGERGYTLDAEFEVESFIARLAAQASQSSHELTRTGDRPCNAGSGRRRLLSALSFVTPCDWANDMG